MLRIPWPTFANRWLWLAPALAVLAVTFILWLCGFAWWSALVTSLLLVCPVLIVWGAAQLLVDERRGRSRLRL